MAADQMVVDESHGLHERVGGDGTDETEASRLERLCKSAALRRLRRKVVRRFRPSPLGVRGGCE